jgi:hypothetical protein
MALYLDGEFIIVQASGGSKLIIWPVGFVYCTMACGWHFPSFLLYLFLQSVICLLAGASSLLSRSRDCTVLNDRQKIRLNIFRNSTSEQRRVHIPEGLLLVFVLGNFTWLCSVKWLPLGPVQKKQSVFSMLFPKEHHVYYTTHIIFLASSLDQCDVCVGGHPDFWSNLHKSVCDTWVNEPMHAPITVWNSLGLGSCVIRKGDFLSVPEHVQNFVQYNALSEPLFPAKQMTRENTQRLH